MKRYCLWVKSLCFFLAAITLLVVAVSGLGIVLAESVNMYGYTDFRSWRYSRSENMAYTLADQVMTEYAGQQSGSPWWLLDQTGYSYAIENGMSWYELSEEDWYYEILDPSGKEVASTKKELENPLTFVFGNMCSNYPVIVVPAEPPISETTVPDATEVPAYPTPIQPEETVDTTPTQPVTAPTEVSTRIYNADEYYDVYYDHTSDQEVWVQYDLLEGYQITIGVQENHDGYYVSNGFPMELMQWLFPLRYYLIAIAAGSLLLFAAVMIFLLYIAGRSPKTGEADPRALNKLPLDLYLAVAAVITLFGCMASYELVEEIFGKNSNYNVLLVVLLCSCGVIIATTDIGFFTAVAAQFKVPGGFWWRHSLCGRVLKLAWKLFEKAWAYVARFFRRIAGHIRDVFSLLPVMWEWILAGGVLGLILVIICLDAHWYTVFPLVVWCLAFAAIVIYCGYCYGTIYKGIRRMREGDLNEKIDTRWMYGSFRKIAEDLNALTDVVSLAAEKQLKAERMKTELITNVSHDIKTPLTSVINYVDLLQKPHTEEEGSQYLEVLSRQSLRLKKLVEDLMDMSKASTGNMAVNITSMDAVEAVNQALGEFSDKLDAAQLTPVFRTPDSQLHMLADGKLTWRVLSNLLSNVVKYALPGTRVYLDLLRLDKSVVLSVKNISREELNISAEELTERFVRGDASRNTEGSGLGLNIAESLMRLQRGNMEITVDGDLFKVTLIFPTE